MPTYKQKIEYHNELVKSLRPYILSSMRDVFGDYCQGCKQWFKSYEIDHKRYAEDITIHDLQLLCSACHSDKTKQSNEARLSKEPHCETCMCYA